MEGNEFVLYVRADAHLLCRTENNPYLSVTDIDKILPPVSRFGGGNRAEKKQGIIDKLMTFFEKYWGLV